MRSNLPQTGTQACTKAKYQTPREKPAKSAKIRQKQRSKCFFTSTSRFARANVHTAPLVRSLANEI